jgi:hypothetical protein
VAVQFVHDLLRIRRAGLLRRNGRGNEQGTGEYRCCAVHRYSPFLPFHSVLQALCHRAAQFRGEVDYGWVKVQVRVGWLLV